MMENQYANPSLFDLSLTENVKTEMKGAAIWAGIAALLSIITTVISIVLQFMEKTKTPELRTAEGFGNGVETAQTAGNIFSVIFTLAINLLFFYFLNRFANLTKRGLNGNNQEIVSAGLGNLSAYFIAMGVVFILILVICLFGIFGLLVVLGTRT